MHKKFNKIFIRFARNASDIVGNPWTFFLMTFLVLLWILTGPIMHFSESWQLLINTSTTIITFLVVFLIQNAQNRDAEYVKILLEELILIHKKASNNLLHADELADEDLKRLQKKFKLLAKKS